MFGLMISKGIQQGFEKPFTIPNRDNSDLMDLMACEQSAWKQHTLGLSQSISLKTKYVLFLHFTFKAILP